MAKKILVIDDEEILTKTFARLLEKAGYEVLICKTGADAVEMAQEEAFDLIICDIRMPGMSGVDAIGKIAEAVEASGQARPPYIFITGYADKGAEEKARVLNPAAYIEKPFDNLLLLNKVKELIDT
ncbi:MAG: hypothetical protein A3G87_08480 [Omnitrophica bacterium RIFCSPLOWO2_12_FULL_50_11]|nr:MAG: hypothetical protein A3G87_08480 [Omnitrophica bacterium RIFCSPLOWO2_12_FULL_50_11]